MAITNTGLTTLSQEVFGSPKNFALPTDLFSTKIDQFKSQSQTVKVNIVGASNGVADYHAVDNNFGKDRGANTNFKSITLGTPQLAGFSISMTDWKDIGPNGFRELVENETVALQNKVNSILFSAMTAAEFTKSIVVGEDTAFDTSKVTLINKNEDYNKLSKNMKPNIILRSGWYENLTAQPSLLNASDRGDTGVNRGGLPYIDYRSNRFFKSDLMTDNGEELVGIVTDKQGICLAIGLEDDADMKDQIGYFSSVITTAGGIPIRFTHTVNTDTKLHNFVWSLTMNTETAQADKLIRLTRV